MRKIMTVMAMLLMIAYAAVAEDTAAAKQYQELLEEYKQEGGARLFAKRFLEFAEQHAKDPAAADALLWVVDNVKGKPDTTKALDMLAKHHVSSEKLAAGFEVITSSRSISAEKLLRMVLEKHPDENTRAQANYYLAILLEMEAALADQLASQPELAPRVLQYYGQDYGKHLASLKPDELAKRREQVFERMLKSFPEVELHGARLGQVAERSLFRIRHLSIGRTAPDIQAEDIQGKEFKLSDYRGKVVMLTFWGHW